MKISADTLYKIERGARTPSAEQFMALNMVAFGAINVYEDIQSCLSDEWEFISCSDNCESIPEEWKSENAEVVREEHNMPDEPVDGFKFYKAAQDWPELFK